MRMPELVFWMFTITAALSALGILLIKDVFKAALLLLCCLLSIAALYILLSAEMLGVTQILLYAGGVIILILFGIMLTSRATGKAHVSQGNFFIGLVPASLLLYVLISAYASFQLTGMVEPNSKDSISATGENIMSTFFLPFEVSAILLLISLIGASVISSTLTGKR